MSTDQKNVYSKLDVTDDIPGDFQNMGGPALFRDLLLFIHSHYKHRLTLHDLAEYANMSDASVSRYIKKHTGKNFEDYVREVRLGEAARQLADTNHSITQIALDHGFSSSSAFNKSFRQAYGTAPGIYRKLHSSPDAPVPQQNSWPASEISAFATAAQPPLPQPDTRPASENSTFVTAAQSPLPQPDTRPADAPVAAIRTNIHKSTLYDQPALKAINMGNASDLRHSKQQRQLLFLAREIGFKYVRICNIFSEEMEYRSGHMCTNLNFDLMDEVLETILGAGCIPIIDLAEKPRIVKKNIYEALLNKREGFFSSAQEEGAVVEAFIRHLLARFGQNTLEKWLFEYWYDRTHDDPDGGLPAYFDSFDRICAIMRKYLPQTAIGGCGLPLVDFDMGQVFKAWKRHPHTPDFLSFEYYPYNGRDLARPLQWMTAWMTSPEHINRETAAIRTQTQAIFGRPLPIYITEWNMSLSNRNYFNDTCAKAALFSNYLCGLSEDISMLAYCAGSDYAGRAYDHAQTFYGGNGLLSRDGIPKPVYYVFEFLKNMGNRCFVRKPGCQITGTMSEDDTLEGCEILCAHPGSFSWNFTERSEDEIDAANMDNVFTKKSRRTYTIDLSGIPGGTYLFTRYSINNTSNNVLEQWQNIRALEPLRDGELDYLKNITRPRMKAWTVSIDHGRLHLEETLDLHETVFIKVRRQPPLIPSR